MKFQKSTAMGCQNSKEADKFDHFEKQVGEVQIPTSNYLTLALLNVSQLYPTVHYKGNPRTTRPKGNPSDNPKIRKDQI